MLVAFALVLAALLTGCSGQEPATAPSSDPVQRLLDEWADDGHGGVAVAMASDDEELAVAAAGSAGPQGDALQPDAAFRVGSLSKTFVSVMVLQLVADGAIGLDDLVTDHAPDLTVARGVTVRQLLAHRTGIPEHTDGELAPAVLADPAKAWEAAEVLDLVADQPRDFRAGEKFAYSNSNYVVAGIVLETVTGTTLADNLRTRIVQPLGLTSTWFAPDGARAPIEGFSRALPGGNTTGSSYRALETAAGAAGALVSSVSDLATFLRALAHGELLPAETYEEMTHGLPDEGWSLGVFPSNPPTETGISHNGSIPGFATYMQYDPSTEDLFVLLVNDDTRSAERLAVELLEVVRTS
ncbi:serine hydrolase domain-containing protein [Cellulomonas sp. NS3]|uniref:serine hydrolase domain-containing protein n=1 Tax=Cellulomonas sp. NS3 TaxID=2973977 RepID=UPI00216199BD|nr:serine hydrolase domain-containing protein [Cellulomonas sp. NS3]